ncbi:MAG: hypothetical protein JNL36_08150 [Candidatus Kapabacteria bacterium]|nr:hypothetical protein [Candidatus Kapabacteria bacterium]
MSIKGSASQKTKKLLVKGFYLLSVLVLLVVSIITFATMPSQDYSVMMVAGNVGLFIITVLLTSKFFYSATFSKGLRYKYFSVLGLTTLGFSTNVTLIRSLQECGHLVAWYAALIVYLHLLFNYMLVPTTTKGVFLGVLISLLSVVVPQAHILLVLLVLSSLTIYKQNPWKYRLQAIVPVAISVIIAVLVFQNIPLISSFEVQFPFSVSSSTKLLMIFLLCNYFLYITTKPTIKTALYILSFIVILAISTLIPQLLSYNSHSIIDRMWYTLLLFYPVLLNATVLSFDAKLETAVSFRALGKDVAIRTTAATIVAILLWFFFIR